MRHEVIKIYVRPDQYAWLHDHGNYSMLLRELIDAAMHGPPLMSRGNLARLHQAIRELGLPLFATPDAS
jgi:hypothetical protein